MRGGAIVADIARENRGFGRGSGKKKRSTPDAELLTLNFAPGRVSAPVGRGLPAFEPCTKRLQAGGLRQAIRHFAISLSPAGVPAR